MKHALCLLLVVVAGAFAQQLPNPHPVAVPDEATAVKIAEKALTKIYGNKQIQSERPFTATLANGVWHVIGSVNCGDQRGAAISIPCVGGAAMADIKQSTGQILRTGHTK